METPPALPRDHRRERLVLAVRDHLLLLFGGVAIAWGLEILDFVLQGYLDRFGIQSRTWPGLIGVVASPFLHSGFGHLASNTLPFLVLGGLVLLGGKQVFLLATAIIASLGGMALWMLGPPATNHIGASLLIFGYLGFLLARGIFERSVFWIVVSLVILVLYGGMIRGVFPGQPGVSWQGHLFGFFAGLIAARVMFSQGSRFRKGIPSR